jgi:hypothetical protein
MDWRSKRMVKSVANSVSNNKYGISYYDTRSKYTDWNKRVEELIKKKQMKVEEKKLKEAESAAPPLVPMAKKLRGNESPPLDGYQYNHTRDIAFAFLTEISGLRGGWHYLSMEFKDIVYKGQTYKNSCDRVVIFTNDHFWQNKDWHKTLKDRLVRCGDPARYGITHIDETSYDEYDVDSHHILSALIEGFRVDIIVIPPEQSLGDFQLWNACGGIGVVYHAMFKYLDLDITEDGISSPIYDKDKKLGDIIIEGGLQTTLINLQVNINFTGGYHRKERELLEHFSLKNGYFIKAEFLKAASETLPHCRFAANSKILERFTKYLEGHRNFSDEENKRMTTGNRDSWRRTLEYQYPEIETHKKILIEDLKKKVIMESRLNIAMVQEKYTFSEEDAKKFFDYFRSKFSSAQYEQFVLTSMADTIWEKMDAVKGEFDVLKNPPVLVPVEKKVKEKSAMSLDEAIQKVERTPSLSELLKEKINSSELRRQATTIINFGSGY